MIFKYFIKISSGNPSPSHLVQHLGHGFPCALQLCICWTQHPRPCPFPWWFCREWVLFSGAVNFASLFGSERRGLEQRMEQTARKQWCFLKFPATRSVPLSSLVLLRAALLAGSRLWNVHLSKQMAPGAHNCCQTCVDFNSPFSLALCEITCLCVVTQLNCQLWWLSLAFTTITGNHQYYLRGWTEEEKNHSGGTGEYFGVSEWSSVFLRVEPNLSRAVISNLHLRPCHLPNHCVSCHQRVLGALLLLQRCTP